MSKKVLLIWDRLGDYHRARVRALEELGADVYSADLAAADTLYQWGNSDGSKHNILSNRPVEKFDFLNRFKNAKKLIDTIKPDILACPYGRSEYHAILLYARSKNIHTVVFCESWYPGPSWKDRAKGLLLKYLASEMFVSGKRAHKHVVDRLRYPEKRVKSGYSVVDNEHFKSNIPLKSRANNLLCVARFSEEKNLFRLIDAFNNSKLKNSWKLKIIGAGPLQRELLEKVGVGQNIEIANWCSYQDLPCEYEQAKVFILPSMFEPWGLVVNEAIAAGIPVLLSSEVGALNEIYSDVMSELVFVPKVTDSIRFSLDTLASYSDEQLLHLYNSQVKLLETHHLKNWAKIVMGY
jgi:glycosyltransferase involved in cell wall biosynthesis